MRRNSRPARKMHPRTAGRAVGPMMLAICAATILAPASSHADPRAPAATGSVVASAAGNGAPTQRPSLLARGSDGVERVDLKISEESQTLVVDLTGPAGRRVLVSYVATYEGRRLATDSKTVTLVRGAKITHFQLSAEVARLATISVNARFAKGARRHGRRRA